MKKNKIVYLIITIIAGVISFTDAILNDMPAIILGTIEIIGLMCLIVLWFFLYMINQKKKDTIKSMNKLSKKIQYLYAETEEECIKKRKTEEKYERKKNNVKKMNEQCNKVKCYILVIIAVMAIFYLPRHNPIISYAKELFDFVMYPFTNSDQSEKNAPEVDDIESEKNAPEVDDIESEKNAPEVDDIESDIKDSDKLDTPKAIETKDEDLNNSVAPSNPSEQWQRFDLKYPEGYPYIDDDEFKELYNILFYSGEDNIDEVVQANIKIWINSSQENNPLDEAVTSQNKTASYFSEIENGFSNENGKLLSSDLLDEVIEGREELLDSYPNGTLAWLLANSYQIYALNYLKQTDEANSILYLYMKSIDNSQKSLEFEMENKNRIINYIKWRYKDIGDCKVLDDEVRLRAYEVYNAIDNALTILNMENLSPDEVEEL